MRLLIIFIRLALIGAGSWSVAVMLQSAAGGAWLAAAFMLLVAILCAAAVGATFRDNDDKGN